MLIRIFFPFFLFLYRRDRVNRLVLLLLFFLLDAKYIELPTEILTVSHRSKAARLWNSGLVLLEFIKRLDN